MIRDTWADSDHPVTIELYYDGTWHDITGHLGDDGISITRTGRDPSEMTLTLDNTGGRYCPRHPTSPLYGLIGRNTPVRASVTVDGTTHTRFVGEVSSWPQRWTTRGTAYTPVECAGVTRRLGQGASPLRSAACRSLATLPDLVAYWPLEDGEGAASIAPAPGTSAWPMAINGSPSLADVAVVASSAPTLTLESARLFGYVPAYTAAGEAQVRLLALIPAGTPDGAVLARIKLSGTLARVDARYNTASGGTVTLLGYSSAGALLGTLAGTLYVTGVSVRLSVELTQAGGDVDWMVRAYNPATNSDWGADGTVASATVGAVTAVELNPGGAALAGVAVGHVTVESAVTNIDEPDAVVLGGYVGETAGARITRLCGEERGIPVTVTAGATEAMGPQPVATLLDLLEECADTDSGILHEARDAAGMRYRTRDSMLAQTPAVTIPYSDNLLKLEPVDDDRMTRNLVTVTRDGGGSATYEVTDGTMSTAAPPSGVGVYDEAVTLSMDSDVKVPRQAEWRAHLGTVDEARWPRIGIELAHPTFRASAALTAAVLGVDLGDRVVITDLPAWLPPDDVDQLVVGITERVTPARYTVELECVPASPWQVPVWDATGARYGGDGTVLAGLLTAYRAVLSGASCMSYDVDDPVGDCDVRVLVALADWTPSGETVVAARYRTTSNQRAWTFVVTTTGRLYCHLSVDGIAYTGVTSTVATGFADGTAHWIRWTRVASTGVVRFYTSADGTTWTQLGTDVAGPTGSLYNSSALLQLGARNGGSLTSPMTGTITAVRILDGIGGSDLVPVDPRDWTDGYEGAGTGTMVTAQAVTEVPVTAPAGLVWTHADGDYDVMVGGERMTVTGVAGTAPSYTLTATRSVNGVVKAHSAGTVADLAAPSRHGL